MTKTRKVTKTTQVLENLQADIINGRLNQGERLQMVELKERYQVGLSPLREALSRLVSSGLVEMEEQCGFKVAPLSLEDFYDLYMLRMHIDKLALELAIERGDNAWEAAVVVSWHQFSKYSDPKTNKKIDINIWLSMQKEFLKTINKGCSSPWLLKISDMLFDQAARYRVLCLDQHFNKKYWRRSYLEEKEALVQAVLARDKNKAVKIAMKNWNQTIKSIADILKTKIKII